MLRPRLRYLGHSRYKPLLSLSLTLLLSQLKYADFIVKCSLSRWHYCRGQTVTQGMMVITVFRHSSGFTGPYESTKLNRLVLSFD